MADAVRPVEEQKFLVRLVAIRMQTILDISVRAHGVRFGCDCDVRKGTWGRPRRERR